VLVKCLSYLHMRNMLISFPHIYFVMEMAGECWWCFPNQFHIKMCFAMYTAVWVTSSFPWSNEECEQQQYDREGTVLGAVYVSAENGIPQSQAWRNLHNDHLYSYHNQRCNNFYQEIIPTMYNFSDGWKHIHSLWILFMGEAHFTMIVSRIQ
jgi:hypothetical protein